MCDYKFRGTIYCNGFRHIGYDEKDWSDSQILNMNKIFKFWEKFLYNKEESVDIQLTKYLHYYNIWTNHALIILK